MASYKRCKLSGNTVIRLNVQGTLGLFYFPGVKKNADQTEVTKMAENLNNEVEAKLLEVAGRVKSLRQDMGLSLEEAAQKLEQSLTPEQKELLDVYRNTSSEEACLVQEYLLEYGVRIGMELQKELQDTACLLSTE